MELTFLELIFLYQLVLFVLINTLLPEILPNLGFILKYYLFSEMQFHFTFEPSTLGPMSSR